jgi:putative ABC transport system permease protein
MDSWLGNINYWTYVRVSEGTTSQDLAGMATESIERNAGDALQDPDRSVIPIIQNITDIYLGSDRMGEIGITSSNEYVNIFLAVAVFILVIASINYINLSTARSSSRAKEVGIKKVTGAVRPVLIRQFLSETLVFTFISLFIALILVKVLLIPFNNLMGKQLEYTLPGNPGITLFFVILAFCVGIISGTYPSFYLSSFMPLKVIKGELFTGLKNNFLRNLLVITQFALAIVLIMGSIMIMRQVQYIRNKDLGFNKDQIIILPLRHEETRDNYLTLKETLIKLPFVTGAAASQNFPGRIFSGNGFTFEGLEPSNELVMNNIDVDEDFIPLYEIKINAGRNFSPDLTTDDKALIINETNRKFLGLEDPIGTRVDFNGEPGFRIIGVVDDFHYTSLHNKVEPLVISYRPNRFIYLNIKVQAANLTGNLNALKRVWEEIDPDRPFDYFFLDPVLEQLYENESRILGLFTWFTLLAIIIALLGLYGLSSFLILKRTKEIGIRKSLGATGPEISRMYIKDFFILVMIANIIALPVGYFSIIKWLQNFEYQTNIAVWIFMLAFLLSILVACLTVLYHSLKASRANPVESLRYE